MSSNLLLEDTVVSFDRLQAEQIAAFRGPGPRRAGSTRHVFR